MTRIIARFEHGFPLRGFVAALGLAAGVSVWGCGSSLPDASPGDLGGGNGSNTGGQGNASGGGSGTGSVSGAGGTSSGAGGTYGGPGAGGPAYGERSSANILFSGHSLMDNPIPDWTVAIAAARGDSVGWEQQIVIGSPIATRTKGDGAAPGSPPWNGYEKGKNKEGQSRTTSLLGELASPTRLGDGESYDTLIITERHDPLDTIEWENTVGFLRHYHDRITDHSDEGRTLFYQVWPDIDKANPGAWIDYVRLELAVWECIAEKANLSLEAESRTKSVAVIPGAVVLARFLEEAFAGNIPGVSGSEQEILDDVFSDNVHLAALGQYVIASALYSAAYGKSPAGAHAGSGLGADTMEAIEALAWDEVSGYFETGYPEGRPLSECRTLVQNEVCPAYYPFRGRTSTCDFWGGSDSPFQFPDDDFLYPAP